MEGLHRTVPGLHHVMSNFVIEIDGDRARGKCEPNEFMLWPEEIYNNLQGGYEDDYVRVDGRWYIKILRVHLPDDTRSVASSGKAGEYGSKAANKSGRLAKLLAQPARQTSYVG